MSNSAETPYRYLGERLKKLRESKSETLTDVSEAVEIAPADLKEFEQGHDRPSEDILLLLFNHFDIEELHANELWKLAGYEGQPDMVCTNPAHDHSEDDHAADSDDMTAAVQRTLMVMVDPRIMYSDAVEAVAGDRGVVLNFSQTNGPGGKPLTVARIGMSREQAQLLMGVLHQVLYDFDNRGDSKQLGDGKK
jgi:transcriptional regulator with XRE-family HTH domain